MTGESVSPFSDAPCDAERYWLGELWACKRPSGHHGLHMTDVIVNGVLCDTGWCDEDAGAIRYGGEIRIESE